MLLNRLNVSIRQFSSSSCLSRIKAAPFTATSLSPQMKLRDLMDVETEARRKHSESHWPKLQLRLYSYQCSRLDSYCTFLRRAAKEFELVFKGPFPERRRIQKWTLLASPFIYKKFRKQLERRTHYRGMMVYNATQKTADVFMAYIESKIPTEISMRVIDHGYSTLPEPLASEVKFIHSDQDLTRPCPFNK